MKLIIIILLWCILYINSVKILRKNKKLKNRFTHTDLNYFVAGLWGSIIENKDFKPEMFKSDTNLLSCLPEEFDTPASKDEEIELLNLFRDHGKHLIEILDINYNVPEEGEFLVDDSMKVLCQHKKALMTRLYNLDRFFFLEINKTKKSSVSKVLNRMLDGEDDSEKRIIDSTIAKLKPLLVKLHKFFDEYIKNKVINKMIVFLKCLKTENAIGEKFLKRIDGYMKAFNILTTSTKDSAAAFLKVFLNSTCTWNRFKEGLLDFRDADKNDGNVKWKLFGNSIGMIIRAIGLANINAQY